MFSTLLNLLQSELEPFTAGAASQNGSRPLKLSDRVTPIAKRVLPGVRLYSAWLVANWSLLAANVEDAALSVQTSQLWKDYAENLSLLTAIFPAQELPAADYMLEEDVDTIGFKPLTSETTIWWSGNALKPKFSDHGVERHHPSVEMLIRVREILVDGLKLAVHSVSLRKRHVCPT